MVLFCLVQHCQIALFTIFNAFPPFTLVIMKPLIPFSETELRFPPPICHLTHSFIYFYLFVLDRGVPFNIIYNAVLV